MWWHLALGRAYAVQGPWLDADPLLYTATGPPAPAAWLADLFLYGVHRIAGYEGLRALHVLCVAAILALVWHALRRAAASAWLASFGTLIFLVLSAYRLFQLRPHLATILATLVFYLLLFESGRRPGPRRIAFACVLFAVWANVHGAFLLGPILLIAAIAGVLVGAAAQGRHALAATTPLVRAFGLALVLGLAATLFNADGTGQHVAYFSAGTASPELGTISDEWRAADLLSAPLANLPPGPTAWVLLWFLVLATPIAGLHTLRRWRRGEVDGPPAALLGLAGAGLVASIFAVRFLWLGVFPLLLLANALRVARRDAAAPGWRTAAAVSACSVLVLAGFVQRGDWKMISGGWPRSWGQFRQPYPAAKYSGAAVSFLEDTGLRGNLFNEYFQGGFLGYRLAPQLRAFVNGTLNVPPEVMKAYAAIRQVRGVPDDESFTELLDRMQIDVFLGNRLPQQPRPNRPPIFTTAHLERTEGWIQVFRNLNSAVYVRDLPRNADNLARVAAYYARAGVPYDAARGFEPARVIEATEHWAIREGLIPVAFDQLEAAHYGAPGHRRLTAMAHLATLHALLGEYEEALALDEEILAATPDAAAAHRRRVWSLLRLDRNQEADAAAAVLRKGAGDEPLAAQLARAARRNARTKRPEVRRQIAARLPLLTREEAPRAAARIVSAAPRAPRHADATNAR